MRILHITAHMGAGAGKAISGMAIADKENEHRIIVLDRPEKLNHITRCRQNGVHVDVCLSPEQEREEVAKADVVVVNWWHHPLLYKTLCNVSNVPSRLVLWCHVNGVHYPQLHPAFLMCFEGCMFTSSASFGNANWSKAEREDIKKKGVLVYGMGDFSPEKYHSKSDYGINAKNIKIGYVGSLDYAKLHPEFHSWLKETIKNNKYIKFELAGDVTEQLRIDVEKAGISDYVDFLGFRTDVKELLPKWDAFIYPLNPYNFATTENALLEAMACGLPIVASDGMVERTIIHDGADGLLVGDKVAFSERLVELLQDKELREKLGKNARITTLERYSITANIKRFNKAVSKTLDNNKKIHNFSLVLGDNPFEWFLSGCSENDAKKLRFLSKMELDSVEYNKASQIISSLAGIYKGKEKGSVVQYCKYYTKDENLTTLAMVIRNYGGDLV